jgi:predicted porin
MMDYRRYLFLVIIVLLSFPLLVWGNEFRLVPSIFVREEYNDNVFFAANDIKRDFVTTISPGLKMVNNTEKLETNLLARLDRFDYADNREFSATDQLYNGKFRYHATPLFNISAEGGYVKDSRPDRDILTSGIILSTVPRNRYSASLSADYQLSEKTALGVSYAFGRDDYGSTRYTDDVSHDVNAGLVYDLGQYFQRVKGRVNLGYSNYVFSDSRIDSVMCTVGFSRDFSETGSILIDSGIRHTWSEISTYQLWPVFLPPFFYYERVNVKQNNDGWGWVGNVSLHYEGERGNGSLTYNRDITPASGLNGAVERNALTLSTQYRMTSEFSILFSAGYYTNKSDAGQFSTQVIDERTIRVSPGVRYEFSKNIYLESSYDYTAVDYLESNTSANRNLLSIRLYIQHPIWE